MLLLREVKPDENSTRRVRCIVFHYLYFTFTFTFHISGKVRNFTFTILPPISRQRITQLFSLCVLPDYKFKPNTNNLSKIYQEDWSKLLSRRVLFSYFGERIEAYSSLEEYYGKSWATRGLWTASFPRGWEKRNWSEFQKTGRRSIRHISGDLASAGRAGGRV